MLTVKFLSSSTMTSFLFELKSGRIHFFFRSYWHIPTITQFPSTVYERVCFDANKQFKGGILCFFFSFNFSCFLQYIIKLKRIFNAILVIDNKATILELWKPFRYCIIDYGSFSIQIASFPGLYTDEYINILITY